MKLIVLILSLALLQGCSSVSRINTANLTPNIPDSSFAFPIDATLMVYVPPSELNETVIVGIGYNKKFVHTPGKDLQNASLEVAKHYFNTTSNLDLTKATHYILKLRGRAELDINWGVYKVEVTGSLFDSTGKTVHETIAHATEVSALIIDENAYYNAYAKAVKELLDLIFKKKGDEVISYAKTASPKLINDGFSNNNQLLSLIATGSGFLVNEQGQVITNHHVVAKCLAISVSLQGKTAPAVIKHVDRESDIAILDTELTHTAYITLSSTEKQPRLGEDILTIGFPLHGMLSSDPSLTTGNISALSGLRDNKDMLQITAPVQQGNSGGPVLNRQGNLVGVVQSKLNALGMAQFTGDIPQNVNFAVSVGKLTEILDHAGVSYLTSGQKEQSPISTPDIADKAVKYAVQVLCRG